MLLKVAIIQPAFRSLFTFDFNIAPLFYLSSLRLSPEERYNMHNNNRHKMRFQDNVYLKLR